VAIQVNIHEAKSQLSKLIEAACSGEEVVVAKAGKPLVKLSPIEAPKAKQRQLGRWKGRIWIGDDFDDPLPEFEEYM
jgi:prevent-host-death family protein